MSSWYLGKVLAPPLLFFFWLGHARGRVAIKSESRHLELVHRQLDDGSVALQERLLLEQVIGAHPVARGRIAVRLLPRDPRHHQDLLARLKHEARIDHPQHRPALALLPRD